MLVEDIKGHSRHQSVAKGVLLVKNPEFFLRFRVIPRAPFVHDQTGLFLRVVFVHDGGVFCDEFIHSQGAAECFIPVGFGEFGCRTFV